LVSFCVFRCALFSFHVMAGGFYRVFLFTIKKCVRRKPNGFA